MNTNRILVLLFAVLPLTAEAQTPPASVVQKAPVSRAPAAVAAPSPVLAPAAVAAPSPAPAASAPRAAADVVFVTGVVKAGARTLSVGDKVNAGDTITVANNSYANLKFADGGRVLLRPDTEFTIEAFKYSTSPAAAPAPVAPQKTGAKPAAVTEPAAAVTGQTAFFRLVRGGFRAISGLIGKSDRQSYRVTTPVATIGIRGTDYEVQTCAGDCPSPTPSNAGAENIQVAAQDLSGLQLADAGSPSTGIVVATNEGSIVLQTPRGEFVVDVGQVALTLAGGQTFKLPALPDLMLRSENKSPKDCN